MKIKKLKNKELESINGGKWIGPFALGWVVSEVISGIYQASKRDCFSQKEC